MCKQFSKNAKSSEDDDGTKDQLSKDEQPQPQTPAWKMKLKTVSSSTSNEIALLNEDLEKMKGKAEPKEKYVLFS